MLTISSYQVRSMTEADIAQVSEIEEESFSTTWPRTAYRRELSNKLAHYLVVVDSAHEPPAPQPHGRALFGLFRRREEQAQPLEYVVGYVGVWLMVDEAHIVAIAVREAYRRRGLGELLLAEAIDLALHNAQEAVSLEVRRSNFSAQSLYEKYRFIKVGVRKRYYSDNHEDAVIMSTPPIQHVTYKEHLAYLRDIRQKRWGETT